MKQWQAYVGLMLLCMIFLRVEQLQADPRMLIVRGAFGLSAILLIAAFWRWKNRL